MKKYIIILLPLLIFITALSGCSTRQLPADISPYAIPIEQILATSGKNKEQISKFLGNFEHNPEKRQCAQFITANLPPSDRTGLSAELLTENLEYAFLARESTLWGRNVSWSDFQHYVLPHRVSQEQAVKWRKLFYNELLPIVSQCKSLEEAIRAVNVWCFSKTGFKSTQRWDQNPLMTISRGWGRCEEAVIFTVCALRSVGIPARQAMVPAWQHSNDNHTWTEVLVNGKWHYLESANPDYGLDHAWFTGSTRKAPLVISYAYGHIAHSRFPVQSRPFGCTLINTTELYAPASSARILVTDKDNNPLPDIKVFISVFNYASFRPVAAKITDKDGKTDVLLGPGSMLISAAHGNSSAYVASTWIPGEQTKRNNILLKLTPNNIPEGNILFRFDYKDESARKAPPKNSEGARKAEFNSIKNKRLKIFEGINKGAEYFDKTLAPAITKAGLNGPQIMEALEKCPDEYKPYLIKNINKMQIADLITIKADDLISNAIYAVRAREDARKAGLEYDEDIFTKYVLNQRIMYEQLSPWRKTLYDHFKLSEKLKYSEAFKNIHNFIMDIQQVARGPLGSSINPLDVFSSKTSTTADEIGVFATAAMRASGIPARYLDEQEWIEFYDGTKWQPFFPALPDMNGNRNATAASKAFYAPWKKINFRLPGFAAEKKAPQYFKDFTISKLTEQAYFSIIEKTVKGQFNKSNNTWEIYVPDEDLYLIGAKRNSKSEPYISVIRIKGSGFTSPR
nr:transglutaminase domain-containing protein [Maridesulfovibrio hydrothermalis]